MRGAAGGRNEETFSKYAGGIRVEQSPSRRQHEQVLKVAVLGSVDYYKKERPAEAGRQVRMTEQIDEVIDAHDGWHRVKG